MSKWVQISGGSMPGIEACEPEEKCDLCHHRLDNQAIEGKVMGGGWAWMCPACHHLMGLGLGLGKGQLYQRVDSV